MSNNKDLIDYNVINFEGNIEKYTGLLEDNSKDGLSKTYGNFPKLIRKSFIPRDENYTLLCADYSQIELRLLAHMAEVESLIKAFNNGGDIHAHTASEIFDVNPEDVTPNQRSAAKTINFGIVYGIVHDKLLFMSSLETFQQTVDRL